MKLLKVQGNTNPSCLNGVKWLHLTGDKKKRSHSSAKKNLRTPIHVIIREAIALRPLHQENSLANCALLIVHGHYRHWHCRVVHRQQVPNQHVARLATCMQHAHTTPNIAREDEHTYIAIGETGGLRARKKRCRRRQYNLVNT